MGPRRRGTHDDEGTDRRTIAVLKSQNYTAAAATSGGRLPYRIDLLRAAGFDLAWTDAHLSGAWTEGWTGRIVRRSEAAATPWAQAWCSRVTRRHAAATLAIFESEGHGVAAVRHLRRGGGPLVIMACWLADLSRSAPPTRRRLYRWLYRRVDRVIVFSGNQADTLHRELGIDRSRIHVVRFGVDNEELADLPTADDGEVVAAGRDLGRDWSTLAGAATGSGWKVALITRPGQIRGLTLPDEIEVVGPLDRAGYLARLALASVVVIPTEIREYPTGQTVLLEAMALGKACVVTDTPAMSEYVEPGRTALTVPPHDADALRSAVDLLLDDPATRAAIGAAARASVTASGGARAMWADIAGVVADAIGESGGAAAADG